MEKQWGKAVLEAPMKGYTTWRIGGPASLMCWPTDPLSCQKLIQLASQEKIPFVCLGKGSNLLIDDDGLEMLVLNMGGMNQMILQDDEIWAQGGLSLSALTRKAAIKGRDLSFAAGIPGTLGGALVMNAGAHGREIGEFVSFAEVLDEQGKKMKLDRAAIDFGYRSSIFQGKGWTILEVHLSLPQEETEVIFDHMRSYSEQRRQKQPLGLPNAGSVYKNPPGASAGALIEGAGLKGWTIGGAQVSPLHANFIVNLGKASSRDVLELMNLVEDKVFSYSGVRLQREVSYWSKKTFSQVPKALA